MHSLGDYVNLGLVFIGIYVQIFLLFTYLGWGRKASAGLKTDWADDELPTVGIIIPCWNEEKSVGRTFDSLFAADYPKDKLEIIFVDDGSTDNTWQAVQKYADHPQVRLYRKENGGKYTALNLGLEKATADIVGCLDADSTIEPDAIRQSAYRFLQDPETMSVVPAMTVENPKSLMQHIQKVEFESVIYLRETFSFLGALFITSGPLSLFRKEVFQKIGGYRFGFQGEDLEIAMRMQYNRMKIVFNRSTRVYTHGMRTWKTLLKQRVRWTYSFLMNAVEYRRMFFNPEYGHLGVFILPIGYLGNVAAVILIPFLVYNLAFGAWNLIHPIMLGIYPTFSAPNLDPFFFSITALSVLGAIALVLGFVSIFIGRSMLRQKSLSLDLLAYVLYPFLSMLWTTKAVWKTVAGRTVTWR